MKRRTPHLLSFAAALALVLGGAPTRACNVPVFRYALEHWPADRYAVTAYHRGPLTPQEQVWLAGFKRPANIDLRVVDLSENPGDARPPELPWLSVRLPGDKGEAVWAGRLSEQAVKAVLESPARREVARRLRAGESAVWVLLTAGPADRDRDQGARVEQQLRRLERSLELPERTAAPEDRVTGEEVVPLRLTLSLLKVSRDDPQEQLLVRALLASEPDLAARSGPMLFPVFGRGRVLYALVDRGIEPGNIDKAATFLVSGCSCTIKHDSLGTDLLLAEDWSAFQASEEPPGAVPLPSPERPQPVSSRPQADEPTTSWPRRLLWAALAGAVLLTLATGRQALRTLRSGSSPRNHP
jgi:hypothetical protein